jgi:hypothetical protein
MWRRGWPSVTSELWSPTCDARRYDDFCRRLSKARILPPVPVLCMSMLGQSRSTANSEDLPHNAEGHRKREPESRWRRAAPCMITR